MVPLLPEQSSKPMEQPHSNSAESEWIDIVDSNIVQDEQLAQLNVTIRNLSSASIYDPHIIPVIQAFSKVSMLNSTILNSPREMASSETRVLSAIIELPMELVDTCDEISAMLQWRKRDIRAFPVEPSQTQPIHAIRPGNLFYEGGLPSILDIELVCTNTQVEYSYFDSLPHVFAEHLRLREYRESNIECVFLPLDEKKFRNQDGSLVFMFTKTATDNSRRILVKGLTDRRIVTAIKKLTRVLPDDIRLTITPNILSTQGAKSVEQSIIAMKELSGMLNRPEDMNADSWLETRSELKRIVQNILSQTDETM
ncbi:hypothetical protein K493DRAFT_103926 [Basidiobolus meristosporus CBS 931.73]|uniref:Uncharacterized protein n=1 Tax=Basidiobolus meristosporus CBS 931.73 TaxID=1314790 RepID=A0A1Y1WXD4_9FUNG|nr:hypothetical protein K493DRAFT_103926 [Basidiobolus meristosporus CBS 931.73]|eukprot:ORX78229.1 hypothetical protein K493DRAFT_103926 [Basidiobolus meristosporus CBS 931.73]